MFFQRITSSVGHPIRGAPPTTTGRSSSGGSSFVPKMILRLLCFACISISVIGAVDLYANNELDTNGGGGGRSGSNKIFSGFSSANDGSTVKRFWGISDSTALVGQIFNFTISKDAFTGKIHSFVVSEAGEPKLPSWLRFDQKTRSFQGIPLEKDIGQYYISVKAQGAPSHPGKNVAKDVFSIDVVDDAPDVNFPNSGTTQKCVTGEVLTVATVIFDADLENLEPENRISLLEKAASVMRIPTESLKLKPLPANSRAFDASAIMAGPGNARTSKNPGAILQWQVGCSGIVNPDQSERITEIEKMSKDGSLGDELNHPVVGWHVTNRQQQSVVRREKRQAHHAAAFAATPVPGFVPTLWPHTTERVDEYTDETNAPESRIVPTMVSPTFSSSSHHHRHHHGSPMAPGERGHHKNRESVRITASPVLPRLATPYAPSLGTPILTPDRPSTYDGTLTTLDIVPTRVSQEEHTPTLMPPSMTPAVTPYTEIKPSRPHSGGPTVIPGIPNVKPYIQNRMRKLSIVAGKVWSFEIPSNTFGDFEDGNTRSLKLIFMTQDRTAIGQSSWIQFDPEKQVLYALPLDENIGKYRFILEALDSNGDAVQDELDVHVRQHPGHRAVHHTFSLSLVSPKWKFPVAIEWEIEVVKKLAKLFGDRNTSLITVKDVTLDPLKISWTNDSLPRHPCPKEQIERLAGKLIKDETGQPTHHLTKMLGKEIKVAEAFVTYLGVCQPPVSSTTPTKTDGVPQMRNAIEQVNATVGEILRFKIPEDTFFDTEDGSTRNLKLIFLTIDSAMVPKSSWVQLDQKSQELYGLPFEGDKGGEFNMIAQDSDGHTANDVFMIAVHPRIHRKSSIEFSMHIEANFNDFNRNTSQKVLVPWKLSKLYGDPDPRYITVNSISKGSVVYSWTNNTLPYHPCPREKIENLVSYLMNDNETISSKLIEAMGSEFRVIKVDTMPMGPCMDELGPTSGTEVPIPPVVHVPTDESEPTTTSDDDIYITTIIPAVVIAIMLIIAAMVACFLYRKRRKGKMTMNENGAFVTKGIPIIFADELDEKNDPAKPPIILRDEKPPLAPMDYPRSISASSRDSTPQTDRKEVANLRDTNADLHHPDPHFSPPYQPPPPFTSSRDNKNSRPKATPTYRQPPPYVPP